MYLTYFRPKMRGNVKKTSTQSTSDLRQHIRHLSENITSDVMLKY